MLFLLPFAAHAQSVPWATSLAPTADAQSLPEDRGADGLAQTLRKLRTWASLMMIVAHPDDEDGGMMAYESRGQGVRTALMTLTRGEGGQNAMSGEAYDALGLMRTNELLLADEYSGTEQFFSRVADFGFSKTKEETLAKWDHDRVLADVVRAVRINRPLVLTSVFTGNITDGHGHHQVSGEMAQEAFTAAGDPSIFPDQIAAGLLPWSPLKVYARAPFFAASPKGMYDYATGKYSPVHVYDYVAKTWSDHFPAPTLSIAEGTYDPVLGQSYFQIAREGWSQQKSQYGGGYTPLSGPYSVDYHRYGSRVAEAEHETSFFDGIDVSLPGMASLAHGHMPDLEARLREIDASIERASNAYAPEAPAKIAPELRDAYLKMKSLIGEIDRSNATASEKYDFDHVLQIKLVQLNEALAEVFGLEVNALVATGQSSLQPQETAPAITPGASFDVRVHVTASAPWGAGQPLQLARAWVETPVSEHWTVSQPLTNPAAGDVQDALIHVTASATAAPTAPYFTRPSLEQPYYDISDPSDVTRPNTPYPVSGWAMLVYDGVPITLGQVVQTTHRVHGLGNLSQPLVVVPPLSVALATHAAIVPAGQSTYSVTATVTNEQQAPAPVTLTLKVPAGITVEPSPVSLTLAPGEAKKQSFEVHLPADGSQAGYTLSAVAHSGDRDYASGFQAVGYPGLRPANLYRPATMLLRPVDVHVAPGLRVGYVMGTGDEVPEALAWLGLHPQLLTREDLLTGDLGRFDTILIGIRAYSARPELAAANPRLLAFVHAGGTLVVEYQGPEYDHHYGPYPLSLGTAERVVDEQAPVTLVATWPPSSLLTFPNRITVDDFAGWFEERGHSFLESWDPHYSTLTQTADPGQDPQRGGLIEARYGSGHYIYVAYALHRQLPEAVPGAFRILANLVSAGKEP